ncbi:MAG: transcriptional regulator NrdR [Pseudomonadota bacterium]
MRCPFCGQPESRVIDSRTAEDTVRRRRECEACGRRWTTLERAEMRLPLVVKKDGRREPFDREKIRTGFRLACRKRPVAADRIDQEVERVERAVAELGLREVDSLEIGRVVQEALRNLDPVAYLRFASVYQELQSPEALLELVRGVTGRDGR